MNPLKLKINGGLNYITITFWWLIEKKNAFSQFLSIFLRQIADRKKKFLIPLKIFDQACCNMYVPADHHNIWTQQVNSWLWF